MIGQKYQWFGIIFKEEGDYVFCKHCNYKVNPKGSTSCLRNHLKNNHKDKYEALLKSETIIKENNSNINEQKQSNLNSFIKHKNCDNKEISNKIAMFNLMF
jgi:hypothetical protein